jgi:sporulation integral membrane protein YtvI
MRKTEKDGSNMKTETWVRLAAIGICTVCAAVGGYVLIRYFSTILLPFAVAALIASVLRPAAAHLRRRTRLPEKLGGTLLILSAVSVLALGIITLGDFLYEGAKDTIASLMETLDDAENPLRRIASLADSWGGMPLSDKEELRTLSEMISEALRETVSTASAALTGFATSLIMGLPKGILSVVVGVIALFYLFFDASGVISQTRFFLSEKSLTRLKAGLIRVREAVGRCMRAYLLLTLLTFSELLAGMLLLNVRRPVLIAFVIALVDLMPVLGAGTVLIPWSILAFASGDMFRGIGLLILFIAMYGVRQFAEPRIVGDTIGVHPFFMLLAAYVGFRLFGLGGVLLVPILLYVARAAITEMAREL